MNLAKRLARQQMRSRIALYTVMLPVLAVGAVGAIDSALRIIYIVLGFSLIIFLHELGHFLVARACSVKCLAFSIGIGPRMCGWRSGGKFSVGADPYDPETLAKQPPQSAEAATLHSDLPTTTHEALHAKAVGDCDYRISWLPLGGYVRMLGQDDMDPTKVSTDPHAFNQRPIWQRMCIVSAGVIMNVIFAAVAFSILFSPGIGVDFPPAFVGQVQYDSPAWKKGIRPGDEFTSIDHQPYRGFLEFTDVQMASALSDGVSEINFQVRHRGEKESQDVKIVPTISSDTGLLAIGVVPMPGTTIGGGGSDYVNAEADKGFKDDPYYQKNRSALLKIQDRDKIVKIDDMPLHNDYMILSDYLRQGHGKPVALWVEHKDGTPAKEPIVLYPRLERIIGVQSWPSVFGMEPYIRLGEPIEHTPAQAAGFMEGDRVIAVGDRTDPTMKQFMDIIQSRPNEPLQVVVERGENNERKAIMVTPRYANGKTAIGVPVDEDTKSLQFATVDPTGEVSALNLAANATIASVDGQKVETWQDIYGILRQKEAGSKVNVGFVSDGKPVEAALTFSKTDADNVNDMLDYRLHVSLENLTKNQHGRNAGEAVLMGMDHTKKFILQVYSTLAGLFRRTVDPSNLHGIVGITKIGYDVQDRGPAWLWYVLAMVSVNLAVANFLPLPIVDGGLFLLLILEKIRGRPLSLKVQSAIQVVGIVLLAGLFLYVTANDIGLFRK